MDLCLVCPSSGSSKPPNTHTATLPLRSHPPRICFLVWVGLPLPHPRGWALTQDYPARVPLTGPGQAHESSQDKESVSVWKLPLMSLAKGLPLPTGMALPGWWPFVSPLRENMPSCPQLE